MPTVALIVINDGAEVNASPLRSNFSDLQSALNALDADNWASGKLFHPNKILQDAAASGAIMEWDGSDWGPDTPAWASYSPTWAALSGTAPAIGDGTLTGKYKQYGKTVHFRIVLTAGASTTFGNGGVWSFTLPATATAASAVVTQLRALDSSLSQTYTGMAIGQTTTTVLPGSSAGPTAFYANTVPFAWATSDSLTIAGTYEAA